MARRTGLIGSWLDPVGQKGKSGWMKEQVRRRTTVTPSASQRRSAQAIVKRYGAGPRKVYSNLYWRRRRY